MSRLAVRIFFLLFSLTCLTSLAYAAENQQGLPAFGALPEVSLQEKEKGLTASFHLTFVDYSGSDLKSTAFNKTLKINYEPTFEYGGEFYVRQGVTTRRQARINDYYYDQSKLTPLIFPPNNRINIYNNDDTKLNASVFKYFSMGDKGSLGFRVNGAYIFSNDSQSADTFIPYISVMYKTPDQSKYFDIGYAHSNYGAPGMDTIRVSQTTGTFGTALFNWRLWSQTRLYYIALNQAVQGRSYNFAVDQKFTYFIVPQKFDLSFAVLFGNRQYAYDVDLKLPYDSGDIQNSGLGISANYNFTKKLSMYADLTRETYSSRGVWGFNINPYAINNNYVAMYYTLGVRYAF